MANGEESVELLSPDEFVTNFEGDFQNTVSSVEGSPITTQISTTEEAISNDPIQTTLEETAYKYNLEPSLLKAIAKQESGTKEGFNPNAKGTSGETGLMQIMPTNWKKYGGGEDPYNVEENVDIGANILLDEITRFSGNEDLALAAYNAGSPAVINAIEKAGYSIKDAKNITFDDIKAYLPDITQEYVPSVKSKLYASKEDTLNSYSSGETLGTEEDLKKVLDPIISDPAFNTLSATQSMQVLKKVYDSKTFWNKKARDTIQKLSTEIWDSAMPNEKPNYGSLINSVPEITGNEKDPDKLLNTWKNKQLEMLRSSGYDPILLGNGIIGYLDAAIDNEKTASRYRNRGLVGTALSEGTSTAALVGKGFVSGLSGMAAAPFRLAGYEDFAKMIDKTSELLPDPARNTVYSVDDKGYIRRDEYGRPITTFQAEWTGAVGNVLSFIAPYKALQAANMPRAAVAFGISQNVLLTANSAYLQAKEEGVTDNEALKAALFAEPSVLAGALGDFIVAGGGKAWIKGLGPVNRAKAIATQAGKGAFIMGASGAAQKYVQDLGVSAAINKDVTSLKETGKAALAMGIAGAVTYPFTSKYEVRPEVLDKDFPVPEAQKALSAPETRELPWSAEGKKLLPYNPEDPTPIEAGTKLHALDLPQPDEQIRLAKSFEDFQNSPDMERTFIIRSPSDVDPELVANFGYVPEILPDGRLKVTKETTHVPEEITGEAPEGTIPRIEMLSKELAVIPKQEEVPNLIARRTELQTKIKELEPQTKAIIGTVNELIPKRQELIKEVTTLKRSSKKEGANKALIKSRLADVRNEVAIINTFLKEHPLENNLSELKTELKLVNDNIKQIGRPSYLNNIKAKENELKDLIITKEIGELERVSQEKEIAKKVRREQQGAIIETKKGKRYIYPFEKKWYVLNEKGEALSNGMDYFIDAANTAKGIISTEAERGFIPSVEKGIIEKPLQFKKTIEVPKIAEEIPAMKRSKLTGAMYSDEIKPEFRNLLNYWAHALKLPETIFATLKDINNPEFRKHLSEEQLKFVDEVTKQFTPKTLLGAGKTVGDKGIVILGKGDLNYESARVASHEIGHVLETSAFKEASPKMKDAVSKDLAKAIGGLNLNDPVSKWASQIIGPDSIFEGDTRPYNSLTPEEKSYLLHQSEYFANNVSEFLLNPKKRPATLADSFYKNIAEKFKELWTGLKNAFRPSESIQNWLNDYFDTTRGKEFLETLPPEKEPTKIFKEGEKERKFAKRVREAESTTAETAEKIGKKSYKPKSPKEAAKFFREKIKPETIDENINEATDFDNNLSYQDRTAYGIEIINELRRQIETSKKEGKSIDALTSKEADLVGKMAEEGTRLGQGVQAFTLFSSMSRESMLKKFKRDLKKFNGKDFEIPPELEEQIKAIHNKIQEVFTEAKIPTNEIKETSNLVVDALTREALNLISTQIKAPLSKALSYYWYANMLSGLSTQTINIAGSGMNLFGRGLATAITNPKNFDAFIKGIVKAAPKAIESAKGVFTGKYPISGKYENRILGKTIIPITGFENKLFNNLMAKPLNFLNNKLSFVFKAMNSADAFFYVTGKEGQAYFATKRALKQEGLRGEALRVKISEELHNSTNEFINAKEQATREWEASGLKFKDRDVNLRAYEIIDNLRSEAIKEISKRFGQLITFTEPPAGSLGGIAKMLKAGMEYISPLKIIFPFVDVVSNVLSQSLDFSPIGIARAALGEHITDFMQQKLGGKTSGITFGPEERLQRLGAGIIGTTLGAVIYKEAEKYLDDPDPKFSIYARGPTNKGEAATLKSAGFKPYTIKIGDTYLRYSETPLAPLLAWIGELHDAYRYSPSFNKKDPGEKFLIGLTNVGKVVLDTGFLKGAANLVDTIRGEKSPRDLVLNPTKSLIPFKGLLNDIAKTTDAFETDPKSFLAATVRGLPFIQGYAGKPALNAFGEPIETYQFLKDYPALSTFVTPIAGRFATTKTVNPEWKFLVENGAYVPQMGTNTSIGISGKSAVQEIKEERLKKQRVETLGRAAYDVLTYDEIYELTKLAGPQIKQGINRLMNKKLTGEKLQDEIEKMTKEARRNAKIKYFKY